MAMDARDRTDLAGRPRVRCDVAADMAQQLRIRAQEMAGGEHLARAIFNELAAVIERVNKP